VAKKKMVRGRKHHRRHSDRPVTTRQKVAFGTAGGAILFGLLAFFWQMQEILRTHTEWAFVKQPPGASEIFRAAFFAMIAFGGALFADFRKVLRMVFNKGDR
jgi:hypothetical protein